LAEDKDKEVSLTMNQITKNYFYRLYTKYKRKCLSVRSIFVPDKRISNNISEV